MQYRFLLLVLFLLTGCTAASVPDGANTPIPSSTAVPTPGEAAFSPTESPSLPDVRNRRVALAMTSDVDRVGARQRFDPDFVIGIVLDDTAKAFYYRDVAGKTILNDIQGEIPVLVWAANNNYHAYVRQVEGQTLSFEFKNGELIDSETGSTWDFSRGLATEGTLTGMSLQSIPSLSSYDWAWSDFYPGSNFYQP
jgi:hypothetical protein